MSISPSPDCLADEQCDDALADRAQIVQHVRSERDLMREPIVDRLVLRVPIVFEQRPARLPHEHAVQIGVGGRAFNRRYVESSLRERRQRVRQAARQQQRRQCAECLATTPVDR